MLTSKSSHSLSLAEQIAVILFHYQSPIILFHYQSPVILFDYQSKFQSFSSITSRSGVDSVQPVGSVGVVVQDVPSHFIVESVQGSQVHRALLKVTERVAVALCK